MRKGVFFRLFKKASNNSYNNHRNDSLYNEKTYEQRGYQSQNMKNYEYQSDPLFGGSGIVVIGIILFLSVGTLCISGEEIVKILISNPVCLGFLYISLFTGICSVLFSDFEVEKTIFKWNYSITVVIWTISAFLSDGYNLGFIEKIIIFIITVIIGGIILAGFAIGMSVISLLIHHLLLVLYKRKKIKYLVIVTLLLVGVVISNNKEYLLDEVIDIKENNLHEEAMDSYEEGNYIEAMKLFLEDSNEESQEYLKKSAQRYLSSSLWSDEQDTWSDSGYGFDVNSNIFFVWDLRMTGLINYKEKIEKVQQYEIIKWDIFEEEGEPVIEMHVNEGKLTFKELTEERFYCENNGYYTRYK